MSPQGKKGRPAASRPDRAAARRRGALLALGVLLVALFVGVAVAQGIGHPSPGEGEVAIVEDSPTGTITDEDFQAAMEQTAARQGLRDVPAEGDPQFELLEEAALSDLILAAWVAGEAAERDIEISDREIDEELQSVIDQQFGSQQAFDRFLEQSGFTPEEARERIRLQLISQRIQESVLPDEPPVTDAEIETYYEENIEQFQQPETRDVRVVLVKDEAEAQAALEELGSAPDEKAWEEVAQRYSIDEATKSSGGLRQGVVEGQSDPAFDEQVFAAPEGELVGPFETDAGFYVIQVEKVTPAETTPLADVSEQIRQTLVAARQQELAQAFQEDFTNKWRARTWCAEGFRIERCANADPPPSACTEELAETTGCEAPVPSTRPQMPGTTGAFGAPAPQGLPQGPITPQAEQPQVPGGLPPGLVPQGTPGVPPQGGAPPVPPGG